MYITFIELECSYHFDYLIKSKSNNQSLPIPPKKIESERKDGLVSAPRVIFLVELPPSPRKNLLFALLLVPQFFIYLPCQPDLSTSKLPLEKRPKDQ